MRLIFLGFFAYFVWLTVNKYSGIVGVVHNVVDDQIAVRTALHFNAVALTDAQNVMNVVGTNNIVMESTRVVVAAQIHAFTSALKEEMI